MAQAYIYREGKKFFYQCSGNWRKISGIITQLRERNKKLKYKYIRPVPKRDFFDLYVRRWGA